MPRTIMEKMDAIAEELEAILVNPYHEKPRCRACHHLLHPGAIRMTDDGPYEDGVEDRTLCAYCKADRNHQAQLELEEDEYADIT